ncbi:hypothetical protein [Cohnella nanjingensis]|uniref:Uncharacterized protein n=1 Tax=Cohnella nanjingensis TaxID=1387779 RepID=A0A7X0VDQ6_9BACL|nr:hypothetical protein [Cohnella nanjingensis]MBB6670207.1 hypothetical protein [Cohnella nanjingensis]
MSNARTMKWVTGGLEIVLAIPFLGGLIVIGWGYLPLVIMFILHIVTLFLSNANRESSLGSIFGIITSCLAWIPILGWFLHLITGIVLLLGAAGASRR